MLPVLAPPGFRIIAHRGASAYAPENTLPAFELAARMGANEVELDAQLTSDGQVILCHDTTLERYGHGAQVVESLPAATMLALDMGSWFSPFLFGGTRLLTLAALFAHYGKRFVYHVEIKGTAAGLVEQVARLIDGYGLAEAVVITSFRLEALAEMRQVAPHLRCGWLIEQIDADSLQQAQKLALFQLCPRAALVNPSAVQSARRIVPEVRAWGLSGARPHVITLIHQVIEAGC
nr:glycerophosphodiester phosphodiesterase family protein [Caldilineaceae bacterium]